MKYKFKTNKVCLFHDVNQWDDQLTRMMCTLYFVFINAKYNGVIKSFTEDDINIVANRQASIGKFDYEEWGDLSDGIEAVVEYIKTDMWIECSLWIFKQDAELKDWLDRWFAVWLWIKVNSTFYNDKLDGKLDMKDYQAYKGNTGHATNILKYNCRGLECSDMDKEYFLDSYFSKSSIYECNIKEVLEDIAMPTKYIIF